MLTLRKGGKGHNTFSSGDEELVAGSARRQLTGTRADPEQHLKPNRSRQQEGPSPKGRLTFPADPGRSRAATVKLRAPSRELSPRERGWEEGGGK